jgi:ABC-type uncharacterized transport system substrate-binding protein
MRRIGLAVVLALSLALAPLPSEALQAGRVPRIGVISTAPTPNLVEAWRQGLQEHGWIDGQNIIIEYRWSQGNDALFPDFAAELVGLKVDVIVAVSDLAVHAAKRATSTIPIVMAAGTDPIASGFVASLARPGGNVTGLPIFAIELAAKQLELLKEAIPGVSRVSVLVPGHESGLRVWSAAQAATPKLGLILRRLLVNVADDVDQAFADMTKERPTAILVLPGTVLYVHLARIVDFAARNRLPAMYSVSQAAHAGGLISYSTPLPDLFRRLASYVDKILKGAKPADLPVELPTRFELVINLKTAKALGLTIPQSVLLRADQVIQ